MEQALWRVFRVLFSHECRCLAGTGCLWLWMCSSVWFYAGNNFSWTLTTGIKFVWGHLQKAVFYCSGVDEAQCFYKCFILSRLQFSIETKKKKYAVVKPTVVVPQFSSPTSVLAWFLPFPSSPRAVTSPFLSWADLTLFLSVCHLLSLAIRAWAASVLIAPPYMT